jgi:hypothetical protein
MLLPDFDGERMSNREQVSVPLPAELREYVQRVAEREVTSQAAVIRTHQFHGPGRERFPARAPVWTEPASRNSSISVGGRSRSVPHGGGWDARFIARLAVG